MSNKHTPRPWSVNGGDGVWIGGRICIYVGDENDALLIAAAPDLLEAVQVCLKAEKERCKNLLPGAPATTYCDKRIAMIEAAIAKATGEDE